MFKVLNWTKNKIKNLKVFCKFLQSDKFINLVETYPHLLILNFFKHKPEFVIYVINIFYIILSYFIIHFFALHKNNFIIQLKDIINNNVILKNLFIYIKLILIISQTVLKKCFIFLFYTCINFWLSSWRICAFFIILFIKLSKKDHKADVQLAWFVWELNLICCILVLSAEFNYRYKLVIESIMQFFFW